VEFKDAKHDSNINLYNKVFGSKPSVADYYKEVSYNKFTYIPAGTGILTYSLDKNFSEVKTLGVKWLVKWAINAADDDINFSIYDVNNNGKVSYEELSIMVVNPGNPIDKYHYHSVGPLTTKDFRMWTGFEVFDGRYCYLAEGGYVGGFAHELGHSLGLPDLYDYGNDSWGIGDYGLMGRGCNCGPVHMTAWEKMQLGWLTPTTIDSDGYYWLNYIENNPNAYIIRNPSKPTEYFLIENRWKGNTYDAYIDNTHYLSQRTNLPDEGILILHVDIHSGGNEDEAHKNVDVECADMPTSHFLNADHLDQKTNIGDKNDLWDLNSGNFNSYSYCNSYWYDGTPSGIQISVNTVPSPVMLIHISTKQNISDLVVKTLTAPSTANIGKSVDITFTPHNIGTKTVYGIYTDFYLSKDKDINTSDIHLGSNYTRYLNPTHILAPGIITLNIPNPIIPGNYYLGAIIDVNNNFIECNEYNNKKYIINAINILDKTPPKVSSTTPANNTSGISKISNILIKFTENIRASIKWNYIKVKNLTNNTFLTITSKTITKSTLTLKTSTRTKYTWYQVTIPAAAVRDQYGNNLVNSYSFKFRTGA
jgi:M6 family metalloprotease-like protein